MRITKPKSPHLWRATPQRSPTGGRQTSEGPLQEPNVDKFETMLLQAREAWAANRGKRSLRREPIPRVQRRLLPNRA